MRLHAVSIAWVAIAALGFVTQAGLAQSVQTAAYTGAKQERQPGLGARQANRLASRALYYSPETWSQLSSWAARYQVTGSQAAAISGAAAPKSDMAADRSPKPRFGFRDPRAAQGPEGWFYDYFTYSPTFYATPNSDTLLYRTATRYFDLDNDGVYDRLSRFWDSDYNGSYDQHERIDFASLPDREHHADAADGLQRAIRYTVNGTIDAMKIVAVNAASHLIVRITDIQSVAGAEIDTSIQTVVDLGPAGRWAGQSLKVSEQMTVAGTRELVGDKQVLIAETMTVGSQQQVVIGRDPPTLNGQIVDVTAAEVDGAQHAFAIVESDSTRHIVDFGPADRLVFNLEPEATISVQGMPVRVYDHTLILADSIDWNGQKVAVQRW